MACFIVPAVEAVVVTATAIALKKREMKLEAPAHAAHSALEEKQKKYTWSRYLTWLAALLWGGVLLLAFEHVWHGEVVPWYPFLTAMSDPVDKAEMFHEMATVGVSMAVMVTAVWGAVVAIVSTKVKKAAKTAAAKGE
ncbi:MAG: hypothetical protein IJI67_10345 [Clostridia bacterium]|nr:hypothetical protein [Clostridia bacterium]